MGDMPMHAPSEPFGWHVLFTTWHPSPAWDVLLLLLLAGYLTALRAAPRRTLGRLAWLRVTSFVLGLLVWLVAVDSAIETYSHNLFYAHMIQHLMLIMLVPALVIAGGPLRLTCAALPPRAGERLRRALVSAPVALLTRPLVGFAIYTAIIVGTHLTSFMNVMLTRMWLHQGEHVLYLLGGFVFFLPILGGEPIRWRPHHLQRIFLLLLAMAPDTIVGIVLLQTNTLPFPGYAMTGRDWGPSPLGDVQIGGGLMWAAGDGLMMCFAVGVLVSYIANSSDHATAGDWLEGVRRRALVDSTGMTVRSADDTAAGTEGAGDRGVALDDLDESEDALDAYNAMLRRLGGDSTGGRD